MENQTLNGPAGGGGAEGGGDDLVRREPGAKRGLKQQAKESVRDAREQVMTQVRDRKEEAKQSATRMVDERKRTLADSVSALAGAFDAAASSLGEENQQRLAQWTRELSGRARRIASYLEQNDTRGLVTDLEGTAREHPATFVGTSFAAGLAAGRFLRSSTRDQDATAGDQGVDFEFHPDAALVAGGTGESGGTQRFSDDDTGNRGGGYGNPGTGFGTTGSSLGATRTGFGDAGFGPTRTADADSTANGYDVNRGQVGTGGAAMASRAAGSAPASGGTASTGEAATDKPLTGPERKEGAS